MSEAEYGESSYWESNSSKQQSQWGSSVVWSSWSKMEKNKGVALEPLENSLTKKDKKAAKLPPPAIVTATGTSPPEVINIRAPPQTTVKPQAESPDVSPEVASPEGSAPTRKTRKGLKKKKTRKVLSKAAESSETSEGDFDNQLQAYQSEKRVLQFETSQNAESGLRLRPMPLAAGDSPEHDKHPPLEKSPVRLTEGYGEEEEDEEQPANPFLVED